MIHLIIGILYVFVVFFAFKNRHKIKKYLLKSILSNLIDSLKYVIPFLFKVFIYLGVFYFLFEIIGFLTALAPILLKIFDNSLKYYIKNLDNPPSKVTVKLMRIYTAASFFSALTESTDKDLHYDLLSTSSNINRGNKS